MPAAIQMIGRNFGLLTVIREVAQRRDANGKASRCFLVRCNCGAEKQVIGASLRSGATTSCGCRQRAIVSKMNTRCGNGDLIGDRFGSLTIVRESAPKDYARTRERRFIAKCECGRETVVFRANLVKGRTKSCGCTRAEKSAQASITHGETVGSRASSEYRSWCAMISRCHCPTNARFNDYGGRGIIVCSRWRADFSAFLQDMGRRPSLDHSIDRINNHGIYEPSNCRWATHKEQSGNRRYNRRFIINGIDCILSEWCRRHGLPVKRVHHRLTRGWSIEEALELITR